MLPGQAGWKLWIPAFAGMTVVRFTRMTVFRLTRMTVFPFAGMTGFPFSESAPSQAAAPAGCRRG